MDIAIVGSGYVGLVVAAGFADRGHNVVCTDSDPEKLKSLRARKAPFFEPRLGEMLAKNLQRISFVDKIDEIPGKCSVVFIAVGTPERPDGSADMEPTFRVLEKVCLATTSPRLVVLKSTVPIGTAELASIYAKQHSSQRIEIVSNPEFLRQGSALKDFMQADRVVVGCASEQAKQTMHELYAPFVTSPDRILFMDNTSAEMVKYAANAFLALKISFINELALLAGRLGADIDSVRSGFTADHRINPAFFNPGIGYGGSCFPKDVHALIHTAQQVGLDLKILKAADEVNERQKSLMTERLFKRFGDLRGRHIAIWGLSFKPDTDDVRRAPSISIIEELVRLGAVVSAFDPVAMENAKKASLAPFRVASSALDAAKGADAVLILTEWPEFKRVDLRELKTVMSAALVFDGRNLFDPKSMFEKGYEYYCVGRSSLHRPAEQTNPLATMSWL